MASHGRDPAWPLGYAAGPHRGPRWWSLALEIADPPLAGLARQSVNDSNGSVPVWFSAAFGLVGCVVAARKPRNPLGWVILAVAGFFALSEDASFYVVASYRLRHGGLPFGWVALLAQPAGRPPSCCSG